MKSITYGISLGGVMFSLPVLFYSIGFFDLSYQHTFNQLAFVIMAVLIFIYFVINIVHRSAFICALLVTILYFSYTIRDIQIDYHLGLFDTNADSLGIGYLQVLIDSLILLVISYSSLYIVRKAFIKIKSKYFS